MALTRDQIAARAAQDTYAIRKAEAIARYPC